VTKLVSKDEEQHILTYAVIKSVANPFFNGLFSTDSSAIL